MTRKQLRRFYLEWQRESVEEALRRLEGEFSAQYAEYVEFRRPNA